MLQNLITILQSNIPLHWSVVLVDAVLAVLASVLLVRLLFKLPMRRSGWLFAAAAALTVGCASLQAARELRPENFGDWVLTLGALLPFACVTLLFFSKQVYKSWLAALCCDAARGGLKYILLMFFGYDYLKQNTAEELLADFFVTLFLFCVLGAVALLQRRNEKKPEAPRLDARLYLLIAVTATVFVCSMLLLGLNNTAERRAEFFITLLNVPLFAFTIGFAVRAVLKSKLAEQNYRNTLSMQLRHYESMEQKNDELRMFRHDLPKTLRPLTRCVQEGRTDEALELLKAFNVELEASRPRYSTGNASVDTVLECEQQTAEKQGASIELAPGSTFPASGIAAPDIYTIFSNALDNAIEAAAKTAGARRISVGTRIRADVIYIKIENPYEGRLPGAGETLKTTKPDAAAHGYGMRSIKKTAAKYGGSVWFETENGVFRLLIELHPQQT